MELPSEYRSFLMDVGMACFPVRRIDGRWRWEGDGAGLTDPPTEDDYDSTAAYEAAEDAYWAMHEEAVFRPEHSVGLLYLCLHGCACRETLVVSGLARGQMWADDTASAAGFYPLADEGGGPLGFARWLDSADAQLSLKQHRNP